MKDIINIIIGQSDISILEQYSSENKELFERYMIIVKLLIKNGKKIYSKGVSLENLITIIQTFFSQYQNNVVLAGYFKIGIDNGRLDDEVKNMLDRIMKNMGLNISIDVDIDSSFSNDSRVERNKVLTLSNGHPTGTETGFVSSFILALLAATIEITSLLYIFMQAME